ncbi:unnamed protein product [Periconia digitata]|uniref:Uncharacterized protein n=1 Tax=Periconia digitata TaxID=1303443 RepID=A0A9W4XM09_9PLEO|nr:unnamed protein product [Periconia digitata]
MYFDRSKLFSAENVKALSNTFTTVVRCFIDVHFGRSDSNSQCMPMRSQPESSMMTRSQPSIVRPTFISFRQHNRIHQTTKALLSRVQHQCRYYFSHCFSSFFLLLRGRWGTGVVVCGDARSRL